VLLAILLPVFCGMIGLIVDGGILLVEDRHVQHAADAAATSAATELRLGKPPSAAVAAAQNEVQARNGLADAVVDVRTPPATGPHVGAASYVEVVVKRNVPVNLVHILSGRTSETVAARAVAGIESSTAGAAVVVLDPDPPPLSLAALPPFLPSLPSLIGGLEVLGAGSVNVDGAVLVNTKWGGVDEHGQPAGRDAGPPYAVACTPILPISTLRAQDLRVVGGVDNPNNYGNTQSGEPSPLRANRLPVLDPLIDLPVPTVSADPANVKTSTFGGVAVVGLPGVPVTLSPGVYDWITIVTGKVVFQPGVYIVRGRHPLTQHSLYLAAGEVQAEGVMFYLTDTAGYSPDAVNPDASDGETQPPAPSTATLIPSAVVNLGLLGSSFSPLNSPGSPFHGMMIYQRRADRRPIVFVRDNLLASARFEGTVYAKWGHVILSGAGDYDARFVCGTMRLITLLEMNLRPTSLLPPANDVFLVE
jgi:Flp pilus assembly protein TadG